MSSCTGEPRPPAPHPVYHETQKYVLEMGANGVDTRAMIRRSYCLVYIMTMGSDAPAPTQRSLPITAKPRQGPNVGATGRCATLLRAGVSAKRPAWCCASVAAAFWTGALTRPASCAGDIRASRPGACENVPCGSESPWRSRPHELFEIAYRALRECAECAIGEHRGSRMHGVPTQKTCASVERTNVARRGLRSSGRSPV
jgi:hypothetical protein